MATKKTKKAKSNVGLKASKFHPLALKGRLLARRKLNRRTLIAIIALMVAVGGLLIYRSFAATSPIFVGSSPIDEQDQIARTNNQRVIDPRAPKGLVALKTANCMTNMNENQAVYMSQTNTVADLGNFKPKMSTYCGVDPNQVSFGGTIAAGVGNSCIAPGQDTCSMQTFDSYLNSIDHWPIILSSVAQYVGAGTYRDSIGRFYTSETFLACYSSCDLSWTLTSAATVASATATRAPSISASVGQALTFYFDVKDNGPDPAHFLEHVNAYRYDSSGKLLGSAQLAAFTQSAAPGKVFVGTNAFTIPSTFNKGDKYCRLITYSNATGAYTGGTDSNKACVTIK